MKNTIWTIAAVMMTAAVANAQVTFNEVVANPPGTDQGVEFIELKSASPSFSMNGLTILILEGDCGAGCVAGTIDVVLPLAGKSTGTNSLFLWRDSAAVLPPGPEAATNVFVQDFVPDIENGSNTWLIVEGFSGVLGQDLDTNNDGTLDARPWARVVDALGYRDGSNRMTHFQYASQLGGLDITDNVLADPNGFTPDCFGRFCGSVASFDLLGTVPGPFTNDPFEVAFFPAGPTMNPNYLWSPGAANIECVPTTGCDSIDFNADGVSPDSQDIDDFLSVYGGGACSNDPNCGDIDFNNDGVSPDTADIEAFLRVFGGGSC